MQKTLSQSLIARFVDIVGHKNALMRLDDQGSYLREWRDLYTGRTPIVLCPGSTDDVSLVLALAHAEDVGIVPQGGNTGLVGGQIPSDDGDEIVLSLTRLKRVRDVDAIGGTMIVEAGVTLAEAQNAANGAGCLLPLSLASEDSAQIGGVLATNAGGTAVLAYGNARSLTLGLEAVLVDGRIWRGLRRLRKDNTGYDLRDLFIGSEGTLGVITAACLKLFPIPTERETAIVAFETPEVAMKLFQRAEAEAGQSLTAFEFWVHKAQEFALTYVPNLRDPFTTGYPCYALIEFSHGGKSARIANTIESLLTSAHKEGLIRDAAIAQSLRQAEDFWRLREAFSEAQKGAGGSIKHDISVPVARIPEFLQRAAKVVDGVCPGVRPVPFGHFGDGNLHYNVTQPEGMNRVQYLAFWDQMSAAIFDLVTELGGSIAAEHGIGQMKRDVLKRYKSDVELDMMLAIKRALDPKGLLNPRKVL